MAQFLRPESDVTNPAQITNDYTAIDESSASDTDYIYSDNNTDPTYECQLTTTGITDPGVGTGHIVRWRDAQADSDAGTVAPSSGGSASSYSAYLYEGATLRATLVSGQTTSESSFAARSYTLSEAEANAISSYTNLRVRFDITGGGGSPTNRRGAAISWVEMEIPDAASSWDLVPAEASHSHAADNVVITHDYTATSQEASHTHTADNVAITHSYTLTVADGTHSHSADAPVITHDYSVSANEAAHSHTADNVTISVAGAGVDLVVQEASHGHTADNVVITHDYTLVVNDGAHAHAADQPTVTTAYSLTVDEASHAHTADNVTVIDPSATNLNILAIDFQYQPTYQAADLFFNEIIVFEGQTLSNQVQAGKTLQLKITV